ncbi:hypothetical protein Bca101_092012 [Brassica carinata]
MVRLRETEVVLRLCIVFLLLLTSVLIGLDSQTKEIAYMHKRKSLSDICLLWRLGWYGVAQKTSNSKWLSYILDQLDGGIRGVLGSICGGATFIAGGDRFEGASVDEVVLQVHKILLPDRKCHHLKLHRGGAHGHPLLPFRFQPLPPLLP